MVSSGRRASSSRRSSARRTAAAGRGPSSTCRHMRHALARADMQAHATCTCTCRYAGTCNMRMHMSCTCTCHAHATCNIHMHMQHAGVEEALERQRREHRPGRPLRQLPLVAGRAPRTLCVAGRGRGACADVRHGNLYSIYVSPYGIHPPKIKGTVTRDVALGFAPLSPPGVNIRSPPRRSSHFTTLAYRQ